MQASYSDVKLEPFELEPLGVNLDYQSTRVGLGFGTKSRQYELTLSAGPNRIDRDDGDSVSGFYYSTTLAYSSEAMTLTM